MATQGLPQDVAPPGDPAHGTLCTQLGDAGDTSSCSSLLRHSENKAEWMLSSLTCPGWNSHLFLWAVLSGLLWVTTEILNLGAKLGHVVPRRG